MIKQLWWKSRAASSYWLARRLFHWPWALKQPSLWRWMEGQYARMAALGNVGAQSFYGHILLFRGQGLGAREEGLRLLRLAGRAGDAKAAYQVAVQADKGQGLAVRNCAEAVEFFTRAHEAGHPLAARHLHRLYLEGGPGMEPDMQQAKRFEGL